MILPFLSEVRSVAQGKVQRPTFEWEIRNTVGLLRKK
jgi:hypothetical protein